VWKFAARPSSERAAYWYLITSIDEFVATRGDNGESDFQRRLDAVLRGFLGGFRAVVIQLDDKDD
jgi:hypothetical protein